MNFSCDYYRSKLASIYRAQIEFTFSDNTKEIKALIDQLSLLNEFQNHPRIDRLLEDYKELAMHIENSSGNAEESKSKLLTIVNELTENIFKFFMNQNATNQFQTLKRKAKTNCYIPRNLLACFLSELMMSKHNQCNQITAIDFLGLFSCSILQIPANPELYTYLCRKTMIKNPYNNDLFQNIKFEGIPLFFQSIYGKGYQFFRTLSSVYPYNREQCTNQLSIRIRPVKEHHELSTNNQDGFEFHFNQINDAVLLFGKYPLCDITSRTVFADKLSAILYSKNEKIYICDCSKNKYSSLQLNPRESTILRAGMIFQLSNKVLFLINDILLIPDSSDSIIIFSQLLPACSSKFRFDTRKPSVAGTDTDKYTYTFGTSIGKSVDHPVRGFGSISAIHAALIYQNYSWNLSDLGSKTGTFVLFKTILEFESKIYSVPYELPRNEINNTFRVQICRSILDIEIIR